MHIAVKSIPVHASFCQSETSEVTIERETTVWLLDRSYEVLQKVLWTIHTI